ncbi:MAG TPA: hypothetical protein VME17_17850 [Bryobacteraceae bacterium]|nr:hypothetical protein [Bryobacteraceae bacterium]
MRALLLIAVLCAAAFADQPAVPRTADGHPDLSGVWQGGSLSFAVGIENAKKAGQSADQATGKPSYAPGQPNQPPYQPWAEAERQAYLARHGIDDPDGRCLLPGVPRITAMPMPLQISQTPGQVIILYEAFHGFRVIPTDGRKHPDDIDPSFLGDSVAHWEGDTLVVDVTGFNDKTWLGGVGTIHSEELHVTERYTRSRYDMINYDVTIEDPKTLTKPWIRHSALYLRPGERLREYECAENNEDILRYEKLLKKQPLFDGKQ